MKLRQDAMTSEQVMPKLGLCILALTMFGCEALRGPEPAPMLEAPYPERQLWAVAPLSNESGSLHADGAHIADHLARQLEGARGISVVPVNRVIAALDYMQTPGVNSVEQAQQLRDLLGVDGLIVGTVSDYDAYDPPKLGLTIELYLDPRRTANELDIDVRDLTRAPTDEMTTLPEQAIRKRGPASISSGFFNAADPRVRDQLQGYASARGAHGRDESDWRLYRISMDLYTEFVSYVVSARLLEAERHRLEQAQPPATRPAS